MVERRPIEVVVAGHICLDLIPQFEERAGEVETLLAPGKLVHVGPAVTATGGAVSNTGLALHRLGVPTQLMGKVGADLFGGAIVDALRRHDLGLAEGMIVAHGEQSSYTVVVNPPGVDRMFLHHPGTNDTFHAGDVVYRPLESVQIFHFGYPPLMRRMYLDGGSELATLFRRARETGVTTSLDMALPDPASEAGRADWRQILARVLPDVDIFLPSLEETCYMLARSRFHEMERSAGPAGLMSRVDGQLLADLSGQLLEFGAALVGLKLGDQGLYLRTSGDGRRLANLGRYRLQDPAVWRDRELLVPCFQVDVVGTTGAGDCTIAGFLAGLLQGLEPESVVTGAVGVGACNVERADATSGVPSWETVQRRIRSGWPQRTTDLALPGWRWDPENRLWLGPADARH